MGHGRPPRHQGLCLKRLQNQRVAVLQQPLENLTCNVHYTHHCNKVGNYLSLQNPPRNKQKFAGQFVYNGWVIHKMPACL